MKSGAVRAWAVAFACTWAASAGAGELHSTPGDASSAVKVETPVSVYESAPWLAGQAHARGGPSTPEASPANRENAEPGVGASSGASGSGSVGSDPRATHETTEYWLIGSEDAKPDVGASASDGAGGSVSFDSSTRGRGG